MKDWIDILESIPPPVPVKKRIAIRAPEENDDKENYESLYINTMSELDSIKDEVKWLTHQSESANNIEPYKSCKSPKAKPLDENVLYEVMKDI